MKRLILAALILLLPASAFAQDRADIIRDIVNEDILPGFAELEKRAAYLSNAAQRSCTGDALKSHFVAAFQAWIGVSHLRFGPSEENNRAFALAFWPDPRGKTPKAIRQLLLDADPSRLEPDAFREQSVAARGFYALEYLLYDPDIIAAGSSGFRCVLIRAIARDIHATSEELNAAWQDFGPVLANPGPDKPYRTVEEATQVLYKSASAGLQFTAEMRLGRPLGTFDKPRPRRAEAWRSGQSLKLIERAIEGSGYLALRLSRQDEALTERLDDAIVRFLKDAEELDDPALAGVAAPQGRIRVEALLTILTGVRRIVDQELGVHLGVVSGFNALDGD